MHDELWSERMIRLCDLIWAFGVHGQANMEGVATQFHMIKQNLLLIPDDKRDVMWWHLCEQTKQARTLRRARFDSPPNRRPKPLESSLPRSPLDE